jgi:hypothetical protein
MTRTCKSLTLAALLLALAAAPAVRATDPEKDRKPPTDSEKLDLILKHLGELRAELKGDIQNARIEAELRSKVLEGQLKALTERVERLEKAPAMTRSSYSSYFQPTPATPPPAGAGTVVLHNTWGDAATVMLNDRAIVVPAYQTVALDNQPAGTYTYEVLVNGFGRIRGPVTRVLNNNDRMIISVYAMPAIR